MLRLGKEVIGKVEERDGEIGVGGWGGRRFSLLGGGGDSLQLPAT